MLTERLFGLVKLAGPLTELPSVLPYLQQPTLVLMFNNSSAGLTPTVSHTFTLRLSTNPGNLLRIMELLRPLLVCTLPTDRRRTISASAAPTLTTKAVHLQLVTLPVPQLHPAPAPPEIVTHARRPVSALPLCVLVVVLVMISLNTAVSLDSSLNSNSVPRPPLPLAPPLQLEIPLAHLQLVTLPVHLQLEIPLVHLQPVAPLPLPPLRTVRLCSPLCHVQHPQRTLLRSIATLSTTPEVGCAPIILSSVPM